MKILLTNINLDWYAGTQMYLKDLSLALLAAGHDVEIYSPELGRIARDIREAGVHVVDSPDDLLNIPDLIHAQHFIPALDTILKFPGVPAIYFLHDRLYRGDIPPKHSQVVQYVAVDHNCLERLIENEIAETDTKVILNWVDTDRFKLREDRPVTPSRALVFSNYARPRDSHFKVIQAACKETCIQLYGIGYGLNRLEVAPEKLLANYDIVFAKAKAAIEAMATGAAVIVCDVTGLAELVTMSNLDHLRRFNFGMKTLSQKIERAAVVKEIRKYDVAENLRVARVIREKATFHRAFKTILDLYRDAIASTASGSKRSDEYDLQTIDKYHRMRQIYVLERKKETGFRGRLKTAVLRADNYLSGGAVRDLVRPVYQKIFK